MPQQILDTLMVVLTVFTTSNSMHPPLQTVTFTTKELCLAAKAELEKPRKFLLQIGERTLVTQVVCISK